MPKVHMPGDIVRVADALTKREYTVCIASVGDPINTPSKPASDTAMLRNIFKKAGVCSEISAAALTIYNDKTSDGARRRLKVACTYESDFARGELIKVKKLAQETWKERLIEVGFTRERDVDSYVGSCGGEFFVRLCT